MNKEIGVVIIHGMGSQSKSFANKTINKINKRVNRLGLSADAIAWMPIHWADILEHRQTEYLKKSNQKNELDFIGLRKFVINTLTDVTAYQKTNNQETNTYEEIHNRVETAISALYHSKLDSKDKPLIVLAHSLGGHIMSNYIWDMQTQSHKNKSEFESMKTLSGIITYGCNIPAFTFAYKNVIPIDFPPKQLPISLKNKAKWLNFLDADDILGYPLKTINQAYNETVDEDILINVGRLISSWNPLSHAQYGIDKDLINPVAKYIGNFL